MKKNEARLVHNGERFLLWQDDKDSWYFSYGNLDQVNTGHRELQPALNTIYESIEDKNRKYPTKKKPTSAPTWNSKTNPSKSPDLFNLLDIKP